MREKRGGKKKKLSQYISRDYSLRVYRHEQIRSIRPRDEHGNSNDTIFLRLRPRGPLFTRLYETFAYDESRTITIQSPSLGFVCILSSPRCFSLYIRPWPSSWIRRLAILLPLAFLIWILFYYSNLYSSFSPFFSYSYYSYFRSVCDSSRDRCTLHRVDNRTARVRNREVNHVP